MGKKTRITEDSVRQMIYVPIHITGCHWGTIVVNMKQQYIRCYDSLGYDCMQYINAMARYVENELKYHSDEIIHITEENGWTLADTKKMLECNKNIPQDNLVDCGVFALYYIDFMSKGKPFDFSLSDVAALRYRIFYSILAGVLTNAGMVPTQKQIVIW